MQPSKANTVPPKAHTLFSAAFLGALLCFGVVLLADHFGWRWLGFAGVVVGGVAIFTGGGAVIAMATRNFRRRR